MAAAAFVGAGLVPGLLLPLHPAWAFLLTAVVITVTCVVAFGNFLPLLAVPSVVLAWRVGSSASSVSIADVVLVLAALAAIPLVDWERNHTLRRIIVLIACNQVVLLVVLAAHPTRAAILEWCHRLALLGGSAIVGAALVRQGRVRAALRLYLTLAALLAVASIVDSARRGFAPPYPLGLHKNFAGNLLMMGILLAYVVPRLVALPPRLLPPLRILLMLGLLSTQSRGSMVALFLGLLVWAVHDHRLRWTSPLPYVLSLLMLGFAYTSLTSGPGADTQFGSVNSRLVFQREAWTAFRQEPLFGKGLRFYRGASAGLQSNPHNVAFETLAESGVVGAAGLVVLMVGSLAVLRRLDHPLGVAALVMVSAKLAHGLFDIYWLAGSMSLPWIVAGMALGYAPREQAPDAPAPPPQPVSAGAGAHPLTLPT
jgi:hypothetical protein